MDGWMGGKKRGKRQGGKEGRKTDEWMDTRKCGDALRCSRSALVSNMKLRLRQSPGCGKETRMSARGAGPGQGAGAASKGRGGGGQADEKARTDRAWSSASTVCADRKMEGQMEFIQGALATS